MKFLLLISLIGLIACGGNKDTPKPVEETKKVVGTKIYGTHTLTTYDDGSKEWTYGAEYTPITDLDAHKAKADLIVSNITRAIRGGSVNWEVAKYETLKGKNWFIIKVSYTYDNGNPPEVKYEAFNMRFFNESGQNVSDLPLSDGEVELKWVQNLNLDENGVVVGTEKPIAWGYWNKLTDFGETGWFTGNYSDGNSVNPTTNILEDYTPGDWSRTDPTTITLEDIGADRLLNREYFAFEEGISVKKDMEKMGAEIEAMEVAQMEDILVDYGLSEERAEKLGKLMNSYNKIKIKRALTSKEKDIFTIELTGLSFDQAANEMVEDFGGLIDRAAELNETSPEAIKELINTIM